MNTEIKKPAYELIETMLETLESVRTGIDKQLEYLIEVVGYEEEDCMALKNEFRKLFLLNMAMQQYVAITLGDGFNNTLIKDELLKLRTYRLLESNSNKKSALNRFAEEYLD